MLLSFFFKFWSYQINVTPATDLVSQIIMNTISILTDFTVVTSPIWWTDAVVRPINVVTCSTKLTGAAQSLTFIDVCINKKKHQINVRVLFNISLSKFINQEYRSFICWWCITYQYHNEHLSILLDRYNWRFHCDCHMLHHSYKDFCPLHTHYNLQHTFVLLEVNHQNVLMLGCLFKQI